MSFENVSYKPERIEAESFKEREEAINFEIAKISLIYAGKKYEEGRMNNPSYKLSQAIKDFTPIEGVVLYPTFSIDEYGHLSNEEKSAIFLADFFKSVDLLSERNGFDYEALLVLLDGAIEQVKEKVSAAKTAERQEDKAPIETKIIKFNMADEGNNKVNENYKELQEIGYSKYDKYLEVHAKYFFESGDDKLGGGMIVNDLEKIAEYIIDKEPATAAVIGRSWLLDSPIARHLGFIKIDNQESEQNDLSAWLQFIDKDGQVSKKRFEKFLEKGELPFKSVKAHIPIEDFLHRYLSEEKKGRITLKEVDEEKAAAWERKLDAVKSFKDDWDDSLARGTDFSSFFDAHPVDEYMHPLSQEEKQELVEYFRSLYDQKIVQADIKNYSSERQIELGQKMNEYHKQYYRDKEVVIE